MPLPDMMVKPVRDEFTRAGFTELRTPEQVDEVFGEPGTILVAVNSMCGCAAGRMRPAVMRAIKHKKVPDLITTVFAGQDLDATVRVREHWTEYPASSPAVALMKDGEVVFMLQRKDIERRAPEDIAADLTHAFDEHC